MEPFNKVSEPSFPVQAYEFLLYNIYRLGPVLGDAALWEGC